jgi:hypothetical protein
MVARTTWPAKFFEYGQTAPVTEEIAQHLARATDQVTRDEREVGRYGVARQKFLIIGPDGSPIIPMVSSHPPAARSSG